MCRILRTKRVWITLAVFLGFYSILFYRLYQIQIASPRSFSASQEDLIAQAEKIQSKEMILDSGRGMILDRKGRPLAGKKAWRLLIFPQSTQQLALYRKQWYQLASLLNEDPEQLMEKIATLKKPMFFTANHFDFPLNPSQKQKIERLQIPGVHVVMADQRMVAEQVGQPVLGQIGRSPFLLRKKYQDKLDAGIYTLQSRIGLSGIEGAFEPFLHGNTQSVLSYVTDGKGKALTGIGIKVKEHPNVSSKSYTLVTSLDLDLQQKIDQIMEEEKVSEGAVIVQDIQTGDILAMNSRSKDSWENKAIMEAEPGSIFKTVTAIAALDLGLVTPETMFDCDGYLENAKLWDANKKGHGRQSFKESYADSCNVVLGKVAQMVGGKRLEEYAKRLGFAQEISWSGTILNEQIDQIPEEQKGVIFNKDTSKNDPGNVARTGIGQQDVLVTPLQAVNLVTSLFHQGIPIQPRLVTEIRTNDGKVAAKIPIQYLKGSRKLKPTTISAIKQMMRQTVLSGTAQLLKSAKWSLAVKTGTAQKRGNKNLYNKWMIGFGPYESPKYAVVVVIHSVSDSNDPRARQIFQLVMDYLADQETKKKS